MFANSIMSDIGSLFAAGTLLSLGGLGLYLYQSNEDDETKENIELKIDDEETTNDEDEAEVPVRSSVRKSKAVRKRPTSKQTNTRRRY